MADFNTLDNDGIESFGFDNSDAVVDGTITPALSESEHMGFENFDVVPEAVVDDATIQGESEPRIPREIKRSHITMVQQISEGKFGEVWRGVLDESDAGGVPGYTAAVKISKETNGRDAEEMLREARVMAQVSGHPNLVSLVGVVTSGAPTLLVISMCENGSLLSVLKDSKLKGGGEGKPPFTVAERIKFGIDIAKGMAHLAAASFVHRDLASRNVLVDALLNCKVADFGLAQIADALSGTGANKDSDGSGDEEEYHPPRTSTFPVRWTAPEAMQTMLFSEATDVWSFGIVMIEIFTDGSQPYAELSNSAVISKVHDGYRAEQPTMCTDELYAIMLECWAVGAADRPTFAKLTDILGSLALATAESDDDAAKLERDRKREEFKQNRAAERAGKTNAAASTVSAGKPASSGRILNLRHEYSCTPGTDTNRSNTLLNMGPIHSTHASRPLTLQIYIYIYIYLNVCSHKVTR